MVFGGLGCIGAAVADRLGLDGFEVLVTSRSARNGAVVLGPEQPEAQRRAVIEGLPTLDVVVWAQGLNTNDAMGALDLRRSREVIEGNLMFVTETLDALVATGRLSPGARLVVVSSVWQVVARAGKFSYTVSKAALGGLVRAAALDLAPHGVLINGVLPGVVDTPMTRDVLSDQQIAAAEAATGFGRLVDLAAVTATVAFLCSEANTAVTGQSIAVDLGFSVGRSL